MSHKITIQEIGDQLFGVVIEEGNTKTEHTVTVRKEYVRKLTENGDVKELVRRSFEFLLEREEKEDILRKFDLSVIQKYFPEYEREVTF